MFEIEDLYELSIDGAFKDKNDFLKFAKSASNEDLFSVLQEGSFSDLNEFSKLISSKKKKEESIAPNTELVSEPKTTTTSSDLQEGVISEAELFPKKQDKELQARTLNAQERNHLLMNKNVKSYSELYSKYTEQTKLSQEEEKNIALEIDNDINNKGIWNTIKQGAKTWWNNAIPDEGLKVDTDNLADSKKEAKKQLAKEGKKYSNEDLQKKAFEIELEKRKASEIDTKKREFLKDLSDEEKKELETYQQFATSSFSKKDKSLLFEQNILRKTLAEKDAEIKNLNAVIKDKQQKGEPIEKEFEQTYNQKAKEYNDLFLKTNKQYNEFLDNKEDLGTAKDNLDLFKRDYGTFTNFVENIRATTADILSGFADLVPYVNSEKPAFTPPKFLQDFGNFTNKKSSELADYLKKDAEEIRGGVMRPMSVDDINGIGDLGSWVANNAIAQQIPILAMIATGSGGLGALAASSVGQKYGEMVEEEEMDGIGPKITYTDNQKTFVPLFTGAAEGVGYVIDAMVLKGAMRTLKAATNGERQLFAKSFFEKGVDFVKEFGTEVSKATLKEVPEEVSVQIFQNSLDKYVLGKDIDLSEGAKDAAAASLVFSLLPGGAVIVRETLKPFTQDVKFDKLTKEVTFLENELNKSDLSEKVRTQLQANLTKKKTDLETVIVGISKDIKSMSKENYDRIVSIEKQKNEIKEDANEIKNDTTLDKNVKEMLLSDFEKDFNLLIEEQKKLTSKKNNFDSLSKERQQYLKDEAAKTLTEEKQQQGETNFKITDEEITQKAIELSKTNPALNETETPTTETKEQKVLSVENNQEEITLDALKNDLEGINLDDEAEVDTNTIVNKSKEITDVLPKSGELKGITEVNVSDDGQELNYGTKTNKKSISVKGLSEQEIKDEIEFEKKLLEKSKKDAETFDENEIRNSIGLTSKEKQDAIKMHKQSLINNEQTEKIVIPFYEKSLELLSQSEIKQPTNKETQQKQEVDTKKESVSELESNKNETKTQRNIVDDEKVQSRVGINDNKAKDNKVQSAFDNRTGQGEVEVTKKTPKAKPLKTPRGKTPLDKRDIKDPVMLEAMKKEVSDAIGLVQQFFISGGRILSTDVAKLYRGSRAEIQARISYARKDGTSINDIAHQLWEKHGDKLKINTQDFSDAVEQVISDFLSPKAMAVDLNLKNTAKGDLVETPMGLMTEEAADDYIKYLQEQEQMVENYLLTLTEEELLQLEQQTKYYEEYEKRRIDKGYNENRKKEPRVQNDADRKSGKSPTPPSKISTEKVEKIEDFGEKIGGARKDFVEKLENTSSEDIANLPLSKSFPEPNYKKLIEDGIISERAARVLKFLYDAIPPKPRTKYRLGNWVKTVEDAIKTVSETIQNDSLLDKYEKSIASAPSLSQKWKVFNAILDGFGFPNTNPKTGAYKIVETVGANNDRKIYIVKGSYIVSKDFESLKDAVQGLKKIVENNTTKKENVKLDVYSDRKTGKVFIGKKTSTGVYRIMEGFDTAKEAFAHLKENRQQLEELWNNLNINPEERRNENRKRIGTNWRNGKNVTPQIFTNAFGFRGVEFGNWVENSKRQEVLNETYDALMDMANALGISPRSISLNGTLAMAFGARGVGKAMAHYESGKVVINLTKKKGAGSLAHEWFHAMDNYFSRKYGQNSEFITNRPRTRINRDGSLDTRIREEALNAFKDLVDAIKKSGLKARSEKLDATKSKLYWSTTIEMAARSFENFIIDKLGQQNEQNDFLANFKETGEWVSQVGLDVENYPYPLKEESDAINGAFQNLFDTMEVIPEPGKQVSSLDNLENLLNEWDANLDKFGKENLSMGLPLLVAKAAIKAMKVAVKTAKTTEEVIKAGLDAIKNSDWYKGLTKEEQSEITDVTVYQVIQNAKKGNLEEQPEFVESKAKIENVAEPAIQEPIIEETKKQSGTSKNPQAFSTRAFKSENLTDATKEKLKKLGLEYDVESQIIAEENAEKIISEFGILEAYKLAKEGQIRGGARVYIQATMFEELNQQIADADQQGDLELVESLSEELSVIMKEFADEKTLSGQEISMLNRIYKTFNIKYDLEFAKQQWKAKFDTEIPSNVEAILKKQEKEIKERDKKIKELETKIGTLEEQESVGNIQKVIQRHKKAKPSESTLKKAAAALRKAKFTKSISDLSKLQSNPADVIKGIFDGAIEVVAKALEAGSTIEQSVKKGINHIKQSDWYKNLSEKSKRQAEKIASDNFKAFLEKETYSIDKESQNGKLKIPAKLIYELVEGGIDNITDLTDAVLEVLQEDYPNLTHREVRDAITGYGKQINETQDEIKLKISKLKTDGKQASALDDLAMGQRPKRSGRKPKDYTAEQRNNIKKIRELLKNLPIDDSVDKEKYYKSALEGYKTRLKNRINDLNEALKKNERIINEKKNLPLDAETEALIVERDKVQKEYDDYFGKPYKSDETLINEIVKRKEKSLRDLEIRIEEIKINKKEKEKPAKRTVSDPKIDALEQQIEKAKEELSEVLEEVGIAESKRLERAKKYVQKSIENYERRIREGDFQPRKPKSYIYDRELIDLKRKQIEAKIKYDLEFEKQEYMNMGVPEKFLEGFYKTYGTFKGVKASFDLSAMLRQGLMLGTANPKEFVKATIDMHKFASSSREYQSWMALLESSTDYIYMIEDGLSITDTSGDVLRSEERFVGRLLQTQIKVFGVDLNLMNASERAYGGFLNSLRVSVYRKLVAEHEALGYTRQKDPKLFKNIAKFVNNATGRGTLTNDKRWAKFWNVVFFSPKMITGNLGLLKDMVRTDSSPYLRKQAFKAIMTYTVAQFIMKALLWQAYKLLIMPFTGEDDDDVTMDMNLVSTDFNKLKIGDTRYDFGKGEAIMIRTLARMVLQEKSKGIDYENVKFDNFKDTSMGELGSFFKNKLNPLLSQQIKLLNNEHPLDIMKSQEEATAVDYVQALFIPITVTEIVDGLENETPKSKLLFDTLLTIYGAGVQTYE